MGIEKIDKNFAVKPEINRDGIKFYDIEDEPFRIYGVFKENGKFVRLPESTAKRVSEGVAVLCKNTAGGRVRFVTDSSYVAIHAVMDNVEFMPRFPLSGSAGFDLFIKGEGGDMYGGSFLPPSDMQSGYDEIIDIPQPGLKTITVEFPLYSDVLKLYIGLDENARLERAGDYAFESPIVYYGSSITQGGCASKPGSSYQSIISHRFDVNYINLGFSGSCKGEEAMEEYIASLDMSVFVYDYDHNAPTASFLEETHEKFFKMFRQAKPDTPVIMMSRPKYYLTEDDILRRDIIGKTYENAVSSGDKNVYFIDGSSIMDDFVKDNGTVDGCHPTDSGFVCMAKRLSAELERFFRSR